MKFAVPRIWRELSDHTANFFFCMVDPSKRRTRRNASSISYTNFPSFVAPVPQSTDLPVPTPPVRNEPSEEESTGSKDNEGKEESC